MSSWHAWQVSDPTYVATWLLGAGVCPAAIVAEKTMAAAIASARGRPAPVERAPGGGGGALAIRGGQAREVKLSARMAPPSLASLYPTEHVPRQPRTARWSRGIRRSSLPVNWFVQGSEP